MKKTKLVCLPRINRHGLVSQAKFHGHTMGICCACKATDLVARITMQYTNSEVKRG